MSYSGKFRMSPLMIGLAVLFFRLAGPASDDAAAAALPKDPCALLKPGEVQAALAPNASVGSGVSDTSGLPMAVGCTYTWGTRTNEWGQTAFSVTVTDASKVWPGGLNAEDIKQRIVVEAKTDGPDASEIAGIADGAVFTTDSKAHDATAKAYVVKGKGVVLWVTFHGGNALLQKDKIITLLKDAVGRL